jgi:hypothetical protein
MNKIVSFSLFGYEEHYRRGAIENLALQPTVYPGWKCRFYVSSEIPGRLLDQLIEGGGEVVVKRRRHRDDGRFWRFLPAAEESVEALIVRDTDSRLNLREKAAVEEWLQSGKAFHIMRDHPDHKALIPAGMWGCRGGAIPQMATLIDDWQDFDGKWRDQDFLARRIYPLIADDCFIHTDLVRFVGETVHPFPTKRIEQEFVGESFQDGPIGPRPDFADSKLETCLRPSYLRYVIGRSIRSLRFGLDGMGWQPGLLAYRRNVYSQNGEDGVLEELLRRLEIDGGTCVEFGAWDGRHLSNTYRLVKEYGWRGLYIEGDPARYRALLRNPMVRAGKITPVEAYVALEGPDMLDRILARHDLPAEPELLSIDIDGPDYDVWEGLTEYRPRIVVIEIDSSIQPHVCRRLTNGRPERSFANMLRLGRRKGYTLVCHTGNMIFVRDELAERLDLGELLARPTHLFLDLLTDRPARWRNPLRRLLGRVRRRLHGGRPREIYWDPEIDTLYLLRWSVPGARDEILVTTARPELLCACGAVLVHPEDERHAAFHGRQATVPLAQKSVPVLSHAYVRPGYESGAIMTASWADTADVDLFRELDLTPVRAIDAAGRMTAAAGPSAGLSAPDARRAAAAALRRAGLIAAERPLPEL